MRAPSAFTLLLAFLLAAAAAASAVSLGRGPMVGGYTPIRDLKDPHIVDIGSYAVKEHDRLSGQSLEFVRVISGKQQVVAGMNYDLIIEAKDAGGKSGQYEAEVYEREWESYRSLTSFRPK